MREIRVQEQTREKRKKHLLSIHETFSTGGYIYSSDRRNIIRVKHVYNFKDEEKAGMWLTRRLNTPDKTKRLWMTRAFDRKTRRESWKSKLTGTFYYMMHNVVLSIAYMNILMVEKQKL